MSMCYSLKQASDETINLLLADADLYTSFMWGEDFKSPQKKQGFIARLFKAEEEEAPNPEPQADYDTSGEAEDLDKAWQGLHYVLCQQEWEGKWPAAFLLSYRETIPQSDGGYGDAQALRSHHVQEVHEFLSTVDESLLRARFDAAKMQELEIYPNTWDEPEELDWLLSYFSLLKPFIQRTANANLGLVMTLC